MDYLKAVLLAVVEGITEFLPISSTGHMILLEDSLRLSQNEAFANAFMVLIQLPAVLAVVVYFWRDLWPVEQGHCSPEKLTLWGKIIVAFLPAAVFGFAFDDLIEERLFNSTTVALALIVGGVALLLLERRRHRERFSSVHEITYAIAVLIGLFQCLAMIPGTSRSAATIIGAMVLGAGRAAAAEFSFFLAVPTMMGATAVKLVKEGVAFSPREWGLIAVGSLASFLVAYAVVALFMGFIRRRDFVPFGYYRVALGALVLLFLAV